MHQYKGAQSGAPRETGHCAGTPHEGEHEKIAGDNGCATARGAVNGGLA